MNYFWLLIKHKWFVFLAGIRIGAPFWRLITHDLSKLSLSEYKYYQKQFFGGGDKRFAQAWLHHQNHNDHHWEYWIPRSRKGQPMKMSNGALLEMVADWLGASRSYEGFWPKVDSWPWWEKNMDKIMLNIHPETQKELIKIMVEI